MNKLLFPVLLFGLSLPLLGACDAFAPQTPPLPATGPEHQAEYFDSVDRVPGHTGENLPYHERAEIFSNNRR